jgi:hypothetical protein
MNAMVEFVSGRCKNELFCAVATAGDVVRVPVGSRFVCSYCGNTLVEVPAARRRIGVRTAAFIGGGMGLAGLCLFAIGAMIGGETPAAATVAPATARSAPRHVAVATPDLAPAEVQAQAAAVPTQVIVAMAEPVQMLTAPDRQTAARLARRTGMLVFSPPVPVTPAIAETPVRKVPPVPPAKAADAGTGAATGHTMPASGSLEATLEALPSPTSATAAPSESDALNDAQVKKQAELAHPPEPPQAAIVATGPTRPFVPRAVTGSAPRYPVAYETDGSNRIGRVLVSCRIDTSGAPSACHLVSTDGGSRFGSSVMNWLGSGSVRFAPILRDGKAVAETQQWSIDFTP